MRWPLSLLFRGDRDAPPAGDAAAARPGSSAAASDPAAGADASARPAAWTGLAPIQRTVGEVPLTAPAVTFGRELAGLRRPDPILRPLGHDVAADGPAGLVSGIATPLGAASRPVAVSAEHAALPPLPALAAGRGVQRRARSVSAARVPTAGAVEPALGAVEPALGAGEAGAGAVPPALADAGGVAHPAPSPRVLPVVEPSATAPALAATRVAQATAPESTRVVAPAWSTAEAPGAAGSVAASIAGSPLQRGAPVVPSSLATLAAATPPGVSPTGRDARADPTPALPGIDHGPALALQHRSLGASRRLGLGPPLAGRPGVQRDATGPDLPLARPGRTSVPPPVPPTQVPPVRRAAAAATALPVLRVATGAGRPTSSASPGDDGPGDQAAGVQPGRSVGPGAPVDVDTSAVPAVARSVERPLVGDPGPRTAPAFMDDLDLEAGVESAEPGEAAPGPLSAPAATPAPAAGSTALRLSAHAGAPPPAVSSPPTRPAHSFAATSQAARSAPLVVARSLRGAEPLRSSAGPAVAPAPSATLRPGAAVSGSGPQGASGDVVPLGRRGSWEGSGSPAGSGWSAGSGWPAGGPLAHAATAPGHLPAAARSPAEPVPVSRLADTGGPAPASPGGVLGWSATSGFAVAEDGAAVVQRAVVVDEVTSEVAAGAGTAERGADAGAGAGAGGAGQDYEEIADRVYDRIRSRFATELLLDRERMGLLIDG